MTDQTTARPDAFNRLILCLAGLLGAAGVGAAAAATHGGDQALMGPLSLVALSHAPVLVALALFAGNARLISLAAALLAAGAILFSADLAMRHFTGHAIVAMAAPTGGVIMILGWLTLAVAGLTGWRR